MRRLLVLCSAFGLLCGALGCECCSTQAHVHGRCDCEELGYGCHYEMYCHGPDHGPPPVTVALPGPPAEQLKAMPRDVMPKDDAK